MPLVFQHGLTGDHQQILTSFTASGYRLITLECRGHGRSEMGPESELSINVFTDDLHALLTHIGVGRAAFAGISMGAAIAANYAAKHPDSVTHLIMVRPAWFDRSCPENMLPFCAAADFLSLYGRTIGKERFIATDTYQAIREASPDNAASLANIFDRNSANDTIALLRRVVTCEPGFERAALSKLSVPIQIHGTPLDVVHPIHLAKRIAGCLPAPEYVELYPKSLDKTKYSESLTRFVCDCLARR
jgi:pimeloyl-ACP methyl ester carboxylesterase